MLSLAWVTCSGGLSVAIAWQRNPRADRALTLQVLGVGLQDRGRRTVTEYDVRSLYLDLIRRNLTRYGMPERIPQQWSLRQRALFKAGNRMLRQTNVQRLTGMTPRDSGLDWPAEAETMIGMKSWSACSSPWSRLRR